MDVSAGNIIIIIGVILGAGVMIWQFLLVNQANSKSSDDWYDDMDATEESLEETEEFLRRMERLSKRTPKEDDDRKK